MEEEKEQSGAEAIAPLFEGIRLENNPCKDCVDNLLLKYGLVWYNNRC